MRTAVGAPGWPEGEGDPCFRSIEELLVQGKVITQEQLTQAREIQQRTGVGLENVLEQQFQVKPMQILTAKAHLNNMRAVDLTQMQPQPEAITLIGAELARRHQVVPLQKMNQGGQDVLVVAVADPSDVAAMDEVTRACGMKVLAVLAAAEQVAEAIKQHYPEQT
jgi:type IV pilus assembly protein PilB